MNGPQVSVVIPTRNRADLVVRAVQSVLGQSMQALEVIVVDDASTDHTAHAIAALGDRRIRYETLESASGAGTARNVGILRAKAPYLALLDSDDLWHPDKVARQYEYFQRQPPSRLVCYAQVRQVDTSSQRIVPKRGIEKGQSVVKYLFEAGGLMQTSTIFLESDLAKTVLFDPSLERHQDYDFCLRLEAAGATFEMVEGPLVDWHVGSGRERVSASVDVEPSINWLESTGTGWDSRTRIGFLVREVVPRYSVADQRRIYTAWLAVRGALHGLVPFRQVMRMVLRIPFPRFLRDWIKGFLDKSGN